MAQPSVVKPESPVAPVAGQKRKRPVEKKFYAVKVGKEPGVYETWDQCLAQVTGQKGAVCEFQSTRLSEVKLIGCSQIIPDPGRRPSIRRRKAHTPTEQESRRTEVLCSTTRQGTWRLHRLAISTSSDQWLQKSSAQKV